MDEKTVNSTDDNCTSFSGSRTKKQEVSKHHLGKEPLPGSELWTDGLICAFEFVRGHRYTSPSKIGPRSQLLQQRGSLIHKRQASRVGQFNGSTQSSDDRSLAESTHLLESNDALLLGANEVPEFDDHNGPSSRYSTSLPESHWVPIGWNRIKELVQTVKAGGSWVSQPISFGDGEDDVTVADLAAPYWERPGGPTWWCHVDPTLHFVNTWLSNAQWLHPAISVALRDESRLISERMKHLLYEVPVRVAGGLLFELLGQSVGDPFREEDDIPIVLRSWHAHNFLVTALHIKGCAENINVLGITEVQHLEVVLLLNFSISCEVQSPRRSVSTEKKNAGAISLHKQELVGFLHNLLSYMDVGSLHLSPHDIFSVKNKELLYAGGSSAPKSVHEVIAHLACRLSRWDDRLFRKYVFGAADEIELKFVNRRNHEDMNLLSVILNQEIRRLSTQVIRVKWSLHAREEIIFELHQHLRGNNAKVMIEGIKKSTREMLDEQEAVRGRLFTIQDVMQSTVRAWLQDRSLRVTHNLAVFGGCGLVLSIITGLFGINVDGIPGAQGTPYAFGLFAGLLFLMGIILIALGMLYLGLKKPIKEEQVNVRKLELQQLVSMFQHDAETHAKVREHLCRHNLPPTAADMMPQADYILID